MLIATFFCPVDGFWVCIMTRLSGLPESGINTETENHISKSTQHMECVICPDYAEVHCRWDNWPPSLPWKLPVLAVQERKAQSGRSVAGATAATSTTRVPRLAHHVPLTLSMVFLTKLTVLLLLICRSFACFSEDQTRGRSHERLAGDATFDYVVVGGGTAGLTTASRLAESQYKVAVVEAGGYYEYMYPVARVPAACSLGAGADVRTTTPIDWGFVVHGVPGANFRDIHYPRGKCLGGS